MNKATKGELEKLERGELISVPARYLPLAKRIAELEAALRDAKDALTWIATGYVTFHSKRIVPKIGRECMRRAGEALPAIDAALGEPSKDFSGSIKKVGEDEIQRTTSENPHLSKAD